MIQIRHALTYKDVYALVVEPVPGDPFGRERTREPHAAEIPLILAWLEAQDAANGRPPVGGYPVDGVGVVTVGFLKYPGPVAAPSRKRGVPEA